VTLSARQLGGVIYTVATAIDYPGRVAAQCLNEVTPQGRGGSDAIAA